VADATTAVAAGDPHDGARQAHLEDMASGVHALQARAEGVEVVDDLRIDVLGQPFKLREKIGLMPLMAFAQTAKSGKDTADMDALSSLYRLLRSCIHPDDWARFEDHAEETAADADDLLKVVGDAITAVTARPTRRPAVSSAGPPTTSPSLNAPPPSSPSDDGEMGQLVSIDELLSRRLTA
jgi:hypothetical protein